MLSLRAFQAQVKAHQTFINWSLSEDTQLEIAQGIEKDMSYQFYAIPKQKIEQILATAC
ncbi:hypothetical protein JCM19235_2091 [Vibrio maritimus]|uniref:Uncharacterized protein n=1 Tax=Vibrio maritimus TaxID=990268 RepID=A0A090RVR0_9VIBR|nr:hypothetical protein JCM19235_2091 [Vibrio maritimus]